MPQSLLGYMVSYHKVQFLFTPMGSVKSVSELLIATTRSAAAILLCGSFITFLHQKLQLNTLIEKYLDVICESNVVYLAHIPLKSSVTMVCFLGCLALAP